MQVSDVSVRAALAVGFSAAVIYGEVTGTPLSDFVKGIAATSVGYYFGGKTVEQAIPQVMARQQEQRDLLAEERARRGAS